MTKTPPPQIQGLRYQAALAGEAEGEETGGRRRRDEVMRFSRSSRQAPRKKPLPHSSDHPFPPDSPAPCSDPRNLTLTAPKPLSPPIPAQESTAPATALRTTRQSDRTPRKSTEPPPCRARAPSFVLPPIDTLPAEADSARRAPAGAKHRESDRF